MYPQAFHFNHFFRNISDSPETYRIEITERVQGNPYNFNKMLTSIMWKSFGTTLATR
jgi:hypothetical protein